MSGYKIEDFLPNHIHMALLSEAASLEVPPAFLIVQIVNDRYAEDESAELEPANSALAYEDEVVEADESYAQAMPPEKLREPASRLVGATVEAAAEILTESIKQEEDARVLREVSAEELNPEFVERLERMVESIGPGGEAIVRSESQPEVDPVSQSHPIDEHGLSNRARNALVRNGILTPEDLTSLSLDDIKGLDGVGAKSYDEIAALVDRLDVGVADGVVVHDEGPESEVGVITHGEEPEPEAGWDDNHPDDEQDAELSFYRDGLAAALAEANTQIRIAKMSELTMARLNACSTDDEKTELGKTIKMNVSRAKMGEDAEVQKLADILIGSLPVRPSQVQQLIELGAELGYDATEVRTSLAAANFGGRSLRMLNFTEGEEFLVVLQDKLAQSAPEDDGSFFEDDGFFEEMEGDDDPGDLFG